MAYTLKKVIFNLMEQVLNPSKVVAVRAWEPATLYEIDIHLPTVDLDKWKTIKRVKCKVDEFEYRDYTPALWDSEKRICTLFIEAGHNGAGSHWVKTLQPDDEILLGVAHAAQLPATKGKILCLADGSALGHFLGLKQLIDQEEYPMDVAVFLPDAYEIPPYLLKSNPDFEFISDSKSNMIDILENWYLSKNLSTYTSIYIAGYIPMVTALRKKLKALPSVHAKIYAYGFWS